MKQRARRPQPGRGAREERPKLFHVAGLPSVAALFARAPERAERLAFDARHQQAAAPFCEALAAARRPFRLVSTAELDRIAGTQLHGGIVALVKPRPVLPFDVGEAKRWAREGQPLLILDGVAKPHNLGAIARTAAFFGLRRLVISDHPQQAAPSEAAWRVSEGGLEHLQVYRAHRLAHMLPRLAPDWLVVATALERGRPLPEGKPRRPVALLLGNEEQGLPEATLQACAEIITLPGSGAVQSLNVAASAAILIHHFAA